MTRRFLLCVMLVTACDTTHRIIGPDVIYCPPLDSALVRARRDSFPSPIYCPLVPPPDSTP